MKKILILSLVILTSAVCALARDTISRDASTLPKSAQSAISKNFKAKVSLIKIDKDFGRVSEYDVTLSDGTEISFDSKGNWKEVEVATDKSVPSAFLPKNVVNYVKKNHAGTRIVGIEKERNGFEVTLSNDIDMKFDSAGNFSKYD